MTERDRIKLSETAAPHEFPLEALGQAIRRERKAAGIGVREMAARLGCSPSHVSMVERGMTSPSVHTLYSMVKELGLSLNDLLAEVEPSAAQTMTESSARTPWPCSVVRGDERRSIGLPTGVKWELLIPGVEDGFEFVEYVYEVGGHDGDDSFRRTGWEYGLVLEGRIGGTVGFAEYTLEAGDSIAFDSAAPHRFWNAGTVPAKGVWVWHSVAICDEPPPKGAARRGHAARRACRSGWNPR